MVLLVPLALPDLLVRPEVLDRKGPREFRECRVFKGFKVSREIKGLLGSRVPLERLERKVLPEIKAVLAQQAFKVSLERKERKVMLAHRELPAFVE
jgi:hypothetical protein